MRSRNFLSALILILVSDLLTSSCYSQSCEEICKKYILSVGSPEKLDKLSGVAMEQDLLMNNAEFAQKVVIVTNRAYFLETKYPGTKITVAVKDTSGWQVNPYVTGNNKPVGLKSSEVANYKYQTDLAGPLFHSEAKGIAVKLNGTEKINGENTYNLLVTYKSGYTATIYLSTKTYMVVRMADKYKEMNYSDYKKVDGIMLPFVTEVKYGGQKMLFNVIKIKVNPPVDWSIFVLPKN